MRNTEVSQAYSVDGFCAAHSLSRALFYLLLKEGRAPRVMKVGRRTLVSVEAAAEWRKQVEAASEKHGVR